MNPGSFIILANAGGLAYEWPTVGETLMYLSGIVFFLILNAVFVAAE